MSVIVCSFAAHNLKIGAPEFPRKIMCVVPPATQSDERCAVSVPYALSRYELERAFSNTA